MLVRYNQVLSRREKMFYDLWVILEGWSANRGSALMRFVNVDVREMVDINTLLL